MDFSYNHSSSRSSSISEGSDSSGYDTLSDYSVPWNNNYGALTIDNVRRHKATLEETYHFVDNRGIQASLMKIISDPALCDVAFLVGEDRIPVYGIRSILATRSRVFEDMILSEIETSTNKKRRISSIASILKKKTSKHAKTSCSLKVSLSGYDVNIFQNVIEFAHCGSVEINLKNVLGLLCGALEFEFEDLSEACWDFVGRNLSSMCSVYHMDQTMQYGRHKCIKDIQIAIIYHIQSHEDLHKQMVMLFPRQQKASVPLKVSTRKNNSQSTPDAQPDNDKSHACTHIQNKDISQEENMDEKLFNYMMMRDDNISTIHSNGLMAQKARQRRRHEIPS